MAFYLDKYNFSVEEYKGQYVMVCRQTNHCEASTEEEMKQVEHWAEINREYYQRILKG